jgi:hypothetical protein
MPTIRLIKHEVILKCGSFEVRFPDGALSFQRGRMKTAPVAGGCAEAAWGASLGAGEASRQRSREMFVPASFQTKGLAR